MSEDKWTSLKSSGATWEPKQTGSTKTNNLTPLEPTEKSYIVGYYVGSEENVGPKNNSTVHKLKLETCGSKKSLISEDSIEKGDEVSIWGTGVLNDMIMKSVSPGQMIKIVWLGKKAPKSAGGNHYHTWDVLVNSSVEPIAVAGASVPEPVNQAAGMDDDDDDLPF